MPPIPPTKELLDAIDRRYPCRAVQLTQLSALVGDNSIPSPPAIVLHGLEATGKTLVLRALLEATGTRHAWLACHECITARHLTERIGATFSAVLGIPSAVQQRCESASALAVYLQQILKREDGRKHFLVLDRIDQQLEPAPTLVAALKRMGESIPTLTVVFIVSAPSPRQFSSAEMPHVHFPPYSKEESIEILSKTPLPVEKIAGQGEESDDDGGGEVEGEADSRPAAADRAKKELVVWQKFCATVWDSLARGAARDVVRFRAAVEANWPAFVQPLVRGDFGLANYASLYLHHKDMFRRETSVMDSVVPADRTAARPHDLPHYSKLLLCAAYLASHNPARLDATFFLKASDPKKRRRRGGVRKQAGTRKVQIQRRLMGAQAFPIERLLAIFPVIATAATATTTTATTGTTTTTAAAATQQLGGSVDIQAQIATLTALRLLARTSSAALDPLDGVAKWKVNVGWEYIRGIARSVKLDIEDFMAD